jgi:Fic family protein
LASYDTFSAQSIVNTRPGVGRYRIQPDDFDPDMREHLVKYRTGYWAFVPPPLPPELAFDEELVSALSAADLRLGALGGAGVWLPNPHLLIRPFIRREAVLSSRIEGTEAGVMDLVLFEAAPESAGVPDAQEVANYVRALEFAVHPDRSLPLSLRLIRDLHRQLMTGVRGEHQTPGEFRRSQNWIGSPGALLSEARFVSPPIDEMNECLDAFEKYLHASSETPPLIRLALVHYQFEAIHPFLDGNGRIGRLLISLLLNDWGLLRQPLLYISAFFERKRAEYYDRLFAVSQRGDWTGWLLFFLEGVAEQSADATARALRLVELRERYRGVLQQVRASALPLRLVDHLFDRPAITVAQAQGLLQVTRRAASLNVEKLVDAGILRETTGRERNRIFVAEEILGLVSEQPAVGTG